MSRRWDAVTVDHELTVRDEPSDGTRPVMEAIPGEPLVVPVDAIYHGEGAEPGVFCLIGLGRPIFATSGDAPRRHRATTMASTERSGAANGPRPERGEAPMVAPIEGRGVRQQRQLLFALPKRINPGRNPVTIEWIKAGGGSFERLAVTDLVVEVDDVSSTRIEVTPKLVKGLLGAQAKVVLENTGTAPVQLTLGASTPKGSGLTIRLSPSRLVLEPGELATVIAHVRRRARWFGASRTHVFDVHARTASGSVTATGTLRQRTVFPPLLLKLLIAIAVIVVATTLLLRLVRNVVDDSSPSTWASVAESPEDLVARSGHTATWIGFERRDAKTGADGAATRARELITGADDSIRGVFVWGGEDAAGRALSTGAIYSVTDGEWLTVEPLPGVEARTGHTAAWTGDRVVIWGGAVTSADDGDVTVVPDDPTPFYGAEYDPTTGDWDPLPDSGLEPRVGHTMIWTGHELIVFGGTAADGRVLSDGGILRAGLLANDGSSNAEEEGDLSNGIWSLFEVGDLGPMNAAPRAFHSAAWDGRYMVVSGGVTSGGTLLSDAYAYDVEHNRWNLVSLATFEPRACHTSVDTGSGVVLLGGIGVDDLTPADRLAGARDGTLCEAELGADHTDPKAWRLEVEASPDDPRIPLYEWQVLADAPEHLGTDIVATWTGSAVGIARLVPELDSVAPIMYVPGSGSKIGALPKQGQLGVRSLLTAAWNGSELFVWGGLTDRPCPDGSGPPECPGSNGALIDVGH